MVKTGLIPIIRLVFIDESAGAIRSSGRATALGKHSRFWDTGFSLGSDFGLSDALESQGGKRQILRM